jgi:digeranylgeranylglycerophospholipid reductase
LQVASKPIEHRTVIIVGAGPAGSAAAQRLAESGVDVLVLERRNIVGNPAQCGECIPNWGEVVGTFRNLDDHLWLKTYFDFPERLILHRLDNMRVFLPSGKSYDFELDAFAGHRLQFDGYLADKAVRAGAEIRTSTPLKRIQQQRKANRELLVTSDGRYTCDYLIDASGSLAHIGRLRHGQDPAYRPDDQVPTVYAQVKGEVPETFDVFLGSVAPSGYAWIIPKGKGFANVGLGVRAGKLKGPLKDHLEQFCKDLNLEILSIGGGWIPMGGPVKTMVDGTTLAVGDAAGLVMPSNGGGISQAIISGCFAAESILQHMEDGTPLSSYEKRVRASMGPALRNSLRSKNMGYAFMRGDVMTELILRCLGPIGGIKRAMECDRPLWVL